MNNQQYNPNNPYNPYAQYNQYNQYNTQQMPQGYPQQQFNNPIPNFVHNNPNFFHNPQNYPPQPFQQPQFHQPFQPQFHQPMQPPPFTHAKPQSNPNHQPTPPPVYKPYTKKLQSKKFPQAKTGITDTDISTIYRNVKTVTTDTIRLMNTMDNGPLKEEVKANYQTGLMFLQAYILAINPAKIKSDLDDIHYELSILSFWLTKFLTQIQKDSGGISHTAGTVLSKMKRTLELYTRSGFEKSFAESIRCMETLFKRLLKDKVADIQAMNIAAIVDPIWQNDFGASEDRTSIENFWNLLSSMFFSGLNLGKSPSIFWISWDKFINKFEEWTSANFSNPMTSALRFLLDPFRLGGVSLTRFTHFIKFFGMPTLNLLGQNVRKLFRMKNFHGYLSLGLASKIISYYETGHYILHFYNYDLNALVITYKDGSQSKQMMVKGNFIQHIYQLSTDSNIAEAEFHRILELKVKELIYPVGTDKADFLALKEFVGDFDQNESAKLFQKQPPGTFLIRTSSTVPDGIGLTCTFRDFNNSLCHAKYIKKKKGVWEHGFGQGTAAEANKYLPTAKAIASDFLDQSYHSIVLANARGISGHPWEFWELDEIKQKMYS